MKKLKYIESFNESKENLHGKIELIGPDIDDILNTINFINNNYKDVKVNPTDFQENFDNPYVHKRNHNYSIFAKLEYNGDQQSHVRFINDLLNENDFGCRLYII
jgi:hypothetical protein